MVTRLDGTQYPDKEVYEQALSCPDISVIVDSGSANLVDTLQGLGSWKRSSSGAAYFFICYVANTASKRVGALKGSRGPARSGIKGGLGPVRPASNQQKNKIGQGKLRGQ